MRKGDSEQAQRRAETVALGKIFGLSLIGSAIIAVLLSVGKKE
jgi:multisubunit Na+/H+ antiporter MnhC subunit